MGTLRAAATGPKVRACSHLLAPTSASRVWIDELARGIRGSPSFGNGLRDLLDQLLDLERLREVVTRAGVDARYDVHGRIATGQHDDGYAPELRILLHLAGEREP